MSGPADIATVQYQSGAAALVWLDLSTAAIATSHAEFRETLCRELQDWAGHVVDPRDGQAILPAVYDHFFSMDIVFIGSGYQD